MLDKAYRFFNPIAIVSSLLVGSCSTSNQHVYEVDGSDDLLNPFINASNAFLPPPYKIIEKKEDAPHVELANHSDHFIPLSEKASHPLVMKWIRYFSKQERGVFQNFIDRGAKYRLFIEKQLIDHGLPKEIFYLAMIESGFIIRAKSRAGAVGPWQFIRGTGKRFGLSINSYVDERLDPIRSTQAAIRYLKSLHKVFNSWELAFAAYNSGESRVMNTIIKHGVRDYWKLIEMKALPRETRNYVPKFIAAAILGQQARSHGFKEPKPIPYPELVRVSVPSPVRVRDLAKKLNITYKKLKSLNPNLLRKITPAHKSTYDLWVPVGSDSKLLAQLQPLNMNSRAVKESTGLSYQKYRIRRGDTLISIARKFKASVPQIRKANKLGGNKIIAGRLINVPQAARKKRYLKYLVRKGDNLYHVAKKFGSSIKRIKHINSMRHSRIYAGQTLKVPNNRG
ncbi:MAG: LysM peptidoglycan-binding domain-containing protein [Oligoflexales bacterium]|nr:LysM peptidoglycan-binding domain-containing protein [Oligoflexales bacterium]